LNYTNGSPCGKKHKKRDGFADLSARKEDHDDDDDVKITRRKSTTISLLCDKDNLDPKSPKVTLAFVGTDEDECAYFFEARSYAACAGIETTPQQLGPGGVFGVMYDSYWFPASFSLLTVSDFSSLCLCTFSVVASTKKP